ncbi:MAG: hypothetical protein QUS14_16510 [Pyrinomonadaceae bacterium]|nr:hypothetical protein [Pyrinomonadaceae bacterium]
MNSNPRTKARRTGEESGAALVMVLLISFLLGTACVAMLTAAGASARNSTDVLSETKAYYAAESGIQAAVNALRFGGTGGGPVNYKTAVNNFANSGDLSTWLPAKYDCDGDGTPDRVRIADECTNAYQINVTDPDNSQSVLSFATLGAQFRAVNADGSFGPWGSERQFTSGTLQSTLRWVANTPNPTVLNFSAGNPTATATIGTVELINGPAGGTAMTSVTEFKVFYQLQVPGQPGWLILGRVAVDGTVTVQSSTFVVSGSEAQLCSPTCGSVYSVADPGDITATVSPKEPTRLLVTATGHGPNRSLKVLEAVLQKTPLNGANSASPFTMNGPCFEAGNPTNTAVFRAGTSATTAYSGVSGGGVVAPAFAFNSPCNLTTAEGWIDNNLDRNLPGTETPQVNPPPAYVETYQLPEWQRTPLQLNDKVQQYRAQAQYTGTYYNPATQKITNPGYVAGQTGPMTGVTFCEGNCTVDGDLGGGILVVTGKLTSLGGFGFRGLILVTGPGGWERAGGGCGRIIGNVVISPYTSANLVTNVFTLPPKYEITGAGCSGVEYASLDDLFEGENSALTNFIRGVAEK